MFPLLTFSFLEVCVNNTFKTFLKHLHSKRVFSGVSGDSHAVRQCPLGPSPRTAEEEIQVLCIYLEAVAIRVMLLLC